MKRTRIILAACCVIFFALSSGGRVHGAGLINTSIGAKAFPMGSAYSAIADDSSAVYYNPGGLVFTDNEKVYHQVFVYTSFNDFRYTANGIEDKSDPVSIIPGLFASYRKDKMAYGFGIYTPYGGGGPEYDNFQNSGYDLEYKMGLVAFTPAFGYKFSEDFSAGAGISLYYGTMLSDVFNTSLGAAAESEYSGISGFGGHVSLLYEPSEEVRVGFTVRSAVPVELEGDMEVGGTKSDVEVEFKIPYNFTLGLAYKPNSDLTIGMDIRFEPWNQLDEMKFTVAGVKNNVKTNYQNTYFLGLGMDYKMTDDLALRSGLKWAPTATKKEGLSPASVPVDSLVLSLGGAYWLRESIELSLTGIYNNGFEREHNSQKYDRDSIMFSLGVRARF